MPQTTSLEAYDNDPIGVVSPNLVHLRENVVLSQTETLERDSIISPLIQSSSTIHTQDEFWNQPTIRLKERTRVLQKENTIHYPNYSRREISHLQQIYDRIDDCGTEIEAYVSCSCSSLPIYNSCNQFACPDCWARKARKQRDKWIKCMSVDKGRSYRFLTLTEKRRYYSWEVGTAVDRLHKRLRTISKLKWWRARFRLWFGTIEIEPVWEHHPNGWIVSFNVHLHLVTSGRMPEIEALRSRWKKYGGGSRVHVTLIASRMRQRRAKAHSLVRYITKYFTDHKSQLKKKGKDTVRSLSMKKVPQIDRAIISDSLRGRHLFVSGGHMRSVLPKRAALLDAEYCYCVECRTRVSYVPYDQMNPTLIDVPPEKGFWVWTTAPPT